MWKEKVVKSPKTAEEFVNLYYSYFEKHQFGNGFFVKIGGDWYDYSGVTKGNQITNDTECIMLYNKNGKLDKFSGYNTSNNCKYIPLKDIQITEIKSTPNSKFLIRCGIGVGGVLLAFGLGFGIYKLIKK